jgi:hypothetical protein
MITANNAPDELSVNPEPGGQWVAPDGAGHVASRFADWNREDD